MNVVEAYHTQIEVNRHYDNQLDAFDVVQEIDDTVYLLQQIKAKILQDDLKRQDISRLGSKLQLAILLIKMLIGYNVISKLLQYYEVYRKKHLSMLDFIKKVASHTPKSPICK